MRYRIDGLLLLTFFGALATPNCDDASPYWEGEDVDPACRAVPTDCDGDIGGFCQADDDCGDGICCRNDDCRGGMCTYLCSVHGDCPPQMLCDGGHCFFTCSSEADCAPGQQCHGESICQYD